MTIRHFHTNRETAEITVTDSHEGMVVDTFTRHSVRIMSDVWADITYAVVYEPNGPVGYGSDRASESIEKGWTKRSTFRNIIVGNSEMYSDRDYVKATVDADADAREIYAAYKRGEAFAAALDNDDARHHRLARERRTVNHGSIVRVTRGRKVPQGTEGVVFWIGNSGYGEKVGLGLPNEDGSFDYVEKTGRYGKVFKSYKHVAWTAITNVEVISELGGRIL